VAEDTLLSVKSLDSATSVHQELHLQQACAEFGAAHLLSDGCAGDKQPRLAELLCDFGRPNANAWQLAPGGSKRQGPQTKVLEPAGCRKMEEPSPTTGNRTSSENKVRHASEPGFKWNLSQSCSLESLPCQANLELPEQSSDPSAARSVRTSILNSSFSLRSSAGTSSSTNKSMAKKNPAVKGRSSPIHCSQ